MPNETKPVRLENWAVCSCGSPYTAPELITSHLHGVVLNHPCFQMGSMVTTSRIVGINGRLITTKSGTVYELGRADCVYKAWCAANGVDIDEDRPIKFLEGEL